MVKKIRTYSDELKVEAVKKVADNNGNISVTAKQLGIATQTLSNWHNKANQGKLVGTEQYDPQLIAVLEENKRVKITTDCNHNKLVYPNILNQQFDAKHPNLAKQCFSGSVTSPISGPMRAGCI